jgi:hypothetical protein
MDPKSEEMKRIYHHCNEVAKAAFETCLQTPATNAGCLHFMSMSRTICVGDAKDALKSGYPLSSSRSTG